MIDAGILEDVLYHIHNWFERDSFEVSGCEISGGLLPANVDDRIPSGAWYRIEGSYLNDGLHNGTDTNLSSEVFDGVITILAIPRPLLRLAEDITTWQLTNGSAADGVFTSESFGGYSYTIKGDNSGNGLSGWRLAFRDKLNAFRKIS